MYIDYNYLKLKYSQNNNNPRYSDGLWNEDNLKNIIFLGIEDINYGGNYGSFTLFSDFKAPLSANTFESFNVIRNTQSYKTARIKIIDYLSIDTEGSEYRILKAFNFERYTFRCITVEHNQTKNRDLIL